MGAETNEEIFQNTLNEFMTDFEEMNFVEQVESKLFLIDEKNNPYIMKYHDVIVNIHKVLGLVDGSKFGPDDVNAFYFIDRQSRVGTPTGPFEIETLFRNHFNLAITMNHIFKFGYIISQIHNYPAKTSDLAALFSIWITCKPGQTCSLDHDGLKQIYEGALTKNQLQGNFNEFLETYTSGKKYAQF